MGASLDDNGICSWGLIVIFLLAVFAHSFTGTSLPALASGIVGLAAAVFLIKGVVSAILGKGDGNLWIGIVLSAILIVLFQGLPFVTGSLSLIVGITISVLGAIATILMSNVFILILVVFVAVALRQR